MSPTEFRNFLNEHYPELGKFFTDIITSTDHEQYGKVLKTFCTKIGLKTFEGKDITKRSLRNGMTIRFICNYVIKNEDKHEWWML